MGLRMVRQTHADMVKETTPQKHTYVSSGKNCCASPYAKANGGENSSDFCTVERDAGAGLHMLVYAGAVAAASKATCTCNYCQSSSPAPRTYALASRYYVLNKLQVCNKACCAHHNHHQKRDNRPCCAHHN